MAAAAISNMRDVVGTSGILFLGALLTSGIHVREAMHKC